VSYVAVRFGRLEASQEFIEDATYRLLVDGTLGVLLTVDTTGTIVRVTADSRELLGYAPDELVGKPLTMLMPERYREAHLAAYTRYLIAGGVARMAGAGGTAEWSTKYFPALRKDGSERDLEITFSQDRAGRMGHGSVTAVLRPVKKDKA
jgi:PAS domain S-box-containing protein